LEVDGEERRNRSGAKAEMTTSQWEVIIIGAGIAGASAAYEISRSKRVLLLEMERQPGFHSTGRSGAVFVEPYGNEIVRALTAASKEFMFAPPPGFCEGPIVSDRGLYVVAAEEGEEELIAGAFEHLHGTFPALRLVDGLEVEAHVPIMRKGVISKALHDPGVKDLDVAALLQGFLRGAKKRGAVLRNEARVLGLERRSKCWHVETPAGAHVAPTVVNAAGGWVEEIAALAGVPRLGITPTRRSMFLVAPPAGVVARGWPLVADVGERYYFKPESGRILVSPSEEDPVEPCDVQPEDLDIALGVDRIERVLDIEVRHIERKWAGLRTFAPDRSPVVGFDREEEGFFWLAGQGGFGIQTAPAMGRLAAALVDGMDVPDGLQKRGVANEAISPARYR
jgi:D-arginine dehydrogenase